MRFGIDLGGTKTELLALAPGGAEVLRRRIATPKDYDGLLAALAALVESADAELGARGSVGLAIPGSESFGDARIKNANTVFLNGRPLRAVANGWRQTFEVGGAGGHLVVWYDPPLRSGWLWLIGIVGTVTVLLALPLRRRRAGRS